MKARIDLSMGLCTAFVSGVVEDRRVKLELDKVICCYTGETTDVRAGMATG